MIATDTYADYDGYTIYTTKRASASPQPKWPELNADYMLQVLCCCYWCLSVSLPVLGCMYR